MEYSKATGTDEPVRETKVTAKERTEMIEKKLTDAIVILSSIDSLLTGTQSKEQDNANPTCFLHELEVIAEKTERVLGLAYKITNTLA